MSLRVWIRRQRCRLPTGVDGLCALGVVLVTTTLASATVFALGSQPPPATAPAAPAAPGALAPATAPAQPDSSVPGKLAPGQMTPMVPIDLQRRAEEEAALAAQKAAAAKAEAARAAAMKKPGAQWYRGNVVTLNASEPNAGFKAVWQFERSAGNDIRLTLDETRKVGPQRGTVLIVGQKALITHELTLARVGSLMAAVDGPTLLLNLTLRMLERAVPDGPRSVGRERTISLKDVQTPIRIDTPSAQGLFLQPWQLTGKVSRKGDAIDFDLLLVSRSRTDAKGSNNTVLRGSWRNEEKKPPVFGDDLSLRGWMLYAITAVSKEVNRQQSIVHEAIPREGFATLGELRKAIELGWPGQPDAVYRQKP